jgi:hypothetical protein
MEGRLEAVEKNQEEQDEKIVGVEKKVSIINRALQKRDERVEEIVVNKVCVRGDQRAGDEKEECYPPRSGRTAGREANMGRKDKMDSTLRMRRCWC